MPQTHLGVIDHRSEDVVELVRNRRRQHSNGPQLLSLLRKEGCRGLEQHACTISGLSVCVQRASVGQVRDALERHLQYFVALRPRDVRNKADATGVALLRRVI